MEDAAPGALTLGGCAVDELADRVKDIVIAAEEISALAARLAAVMD